MTRTVSATTEALNRERETAIPSCGPARLGGRRDRDRHERRAALLSGSAVTGPYAVSTVLRYGTVRAAGPPPE
eukprot:81900-Hanusia_phi.AAC.1